MDGSILIDIMNVL